MSSLKKAFSKAKSRLLGKNPTGHPLIKEPGVMGSGDIKVPDVMPGKGTFVGPDGKPRSGAGRK